MGNLKQLIVGCSMVAASPEKFRCPQVFKAVIGAIQGIPLEHAHVQVIRLVKGHREWLSASSRGAEVQECHNGKWHYRFFYDRDKKEIYRCVVYHEDLESHPDPLNPEYTSVAIQYKPSMKSLNSFIRFPTLKILQTVEIGDWKFVAYTDKAVACYRIVMTGPEGEEVYPAEIATTAENPEQFGSMMTHAFAALKAGQG